ncbi:GNAT family N-acetyltransferase [Rhodanobacter sp. L36]|uniref:GNAT family N-acetyltransferase n=1 Tax=Rhodanobacter sp. L36 TaxID=1747221 RepID=UPI00131D97CD|nr:GNAT family N-acetyltransferase [Rhodanobacter sp. L36]
MPTVRAYDASDAKAWDAAVERSRNGNFLHRRSYMDYHADRFVDCSLVIEQRGEIVGVFPANITDATVTSHAGLTYGGLITTHALRAESTLEVFQQMAERFRALQVNRVIYKAVPHVYHAYPAEEDLYALHRMGARLQRRDLSSAIALQETFHFTEGRRHAIDKARKAGIRISGTDDIDTFHALLVDVLRKHGVAPTHSLAELRLLQSRFPQQILVHEARIDDELLAGVLVYDFGRVAHTQYMAVSDEGRRLDALTLLLADLIGNTYATRQHFTLGISTTQEGRELNGGLVAQKEYFGARALVHDFYEWPL